jgi:hypothetical protein
VNQHAKDLVMHSVSRAGWTLAIARRRDPASVLPLGPGSRNAPDPVDQDKGMSICTSEA